MSNFKTVIDEFKSVLSYYHIISLVVILGISVNFIFSIDIYFTDITSLNVKIYNHTINRALLSSCVIIVYLLSLTYLVYFYLSSLSRLNKYVSELESNNVNALNELKHFLWTKLFKTFAIRSIAITISLCIVFSRGMIATCTDYTCIAIIPGVSHLYCIALLVLILIIEFPTFNFLVLYSRYLYVPSSDCEHEGINKVKYLVFDTMHSMSRNRHATFSFMLFFGLFGLILFGFALKFIK